MNTKLSKRELRAFLKIKKREVSKSNSFAEKLRTWAPVAANLVTVFAGTGAFCLYLWSLHGDYVKERDPKFSGFWINSAEGCIGCPWDDNKETIKLNIGASNGEVSGEIYIDDPFGQDKPNHKKSAKEQEAELWKSYTNYFMVEGNLTFYGGTLYFWDYRLGEKTEFAKAHITLKNGSLYLDTLDRAYTTIPLHIIFNPDLDHHDEEDQSSKEKKQLNSP